MIPNALGNRGYARRAHVRPLPRHGSSKPDALGACPTPDARRVSPVLEVGHHGALGAKRPERKEAALSGKRFFQAGWHHLAGGSDRRTLVIVVNYLLTLDGWTAELIEESQVGEVEPDVLDWVGSSPTAREIFYAVTVKIRTLSDRKDIAVRAVHTVAGDPESWLEIARRAGFDHLVPR